MAGVEDDTITLKARGAAAPCYSTLAQATAVEELVMELKSRGKQGGKRTSATRNPN